MRVARAVRGWLVAVVVAATAPVPAAWPHGGAYKGPPPPPPEPPPPVPPPPPPPPPGQTPPGRPAPPGTTPPPAPDPSGPTTPTPAPPTHPTPPAPSTPADPSKPGAPPVRPTPPTAPSHPTPPPTTPPDPSAPPADPGTAGPVTPPGAPTEPPPPSDPGAPPQGAPTTPSGPTRPDGSSSPVQPEAPSAGPVRDGPKRPDDAPPPPAEPPPPAAPTTPNDDGGGSGTPSAPPTAGAGPAATPGARPGTGSGSADGSPRGGGADRGHDRGRGGSAAPGGDWRTWWEANAEALLRDGPDVAPPTTDGGPDAARRLAAVRARDAVPALRVAAAGRLGGDADLRASACLALAKATSDPDDVALLLSVARDPRAPTMTREGATLALGCLRRTDPAVRFDGVTLDRLRGDLFELLDDPAAPRRVRCFAALSLGLLGDQPWRDGEPFARDGRATTYGLWVRFSEDACDPELGVAMLHALSMQPLAGVPAAVRDGIRACAATGRVGRRDRGATTQANAVLAYARLVGAEASGVCLALARVARERPVVRRSAIVALGPMAAGLSPASRAAALADLLAHVRRSEPDTAGFAAIAAGRLLSAAYGDPSDPRRTTAAAAGLLADVAARGNGAVRPFAALALGLAFRAPAGGTPCDDAARDREPALAVLRDVLDRAGDDPEVRGAAAIALGLARDEASVPRLGRLAASSEGGETVRTYACAGLGLLRVRGPAVLAALRSALARRASDDLRREAGRALGVLADPEALPMLVAEIRADVPDATRAGAALALGGLKDARAVAPLVALVADRTVADLARAVGAAALGLVVDPEPVRSLSRLGTDVNYLALTDALAEALSML